MQFFSIVLANRPHGSCKHSAWKCTFLKPVLGVEKSANAALAFLCGQQICIPSETMKPSPHPSTSCLRPLNPATSNNNNSGGLHACVCAAEDIEPFLQLTRLVVECESQQRFDLINGPHKRLLLCLVSLSVCLFTTGGKSNWFLDELWFGYGWFWIDSQMSNWFSTC